MANYAQNIVLEASTQNYNLSGTTPFTLTVIPQNLKTINKKVFKIEYNWSNNEKTTINYEPSFDVALGLPIPNDVKNPLNYPQSKEFYSNSNDDQTKLNKLTVNVYYFGQSNPDVFNIDLFLSKPDIEKEFFTKINLLTTRMFGPNNTILYVFETEEPHYILMSVVDWSLKETPNIVNETIKSLKDRPYSFSLPFVDKFSTASPENSAIEISRYIQRYNVTNSNQNDFGGYGI